MSGEETMPVMVRMFLILLMLALPTACAKPGAPLISPIPDAEMRYGCGCAFRLDGVTPFQFIAVTGFAFTEPVMVIRGEVVSPVVVAIEDLPQEPNPGDRFAQRYRHGDVELLFENVVTSVCPDGVPGCEANSFDTTLTVSDGDVREVYRLKGDCGC